MTVMKTTQKKAVFGAVLAILLGFAATGQAQEDRLSELKKAARAGRKDLAAQIAYGRALIKADRLGPAETQMKYVVKLDKGSIEAMYELARAKFAGGNYKTSRAYCKTLVAKDRSHVLSHVCMARSFLVWRRSSRAAEHINAAIAIDPSNYDALLALGDARRMEGNKAAAQGAYSDAIKSAPERTEAHLGLGRLHNVLGSKPDAVAAFEKAIELDPNDPEIQFELGRMSAGPQGVKLLAKALLGRPKWPDARLALAQAKLDAGQVDSALQSFDQILKKEPGNAGAASGRALSLIAKKNYPDAEPALMRALELQPHDRDATLALAELYRSTDRHEEAFNQYRAAASIARTDSKPFILAAELALSIKRTLLAAAFLEKALERAPRSGQALALYARVLAERGDRAAAKDYYHRALTGVGEIDRAAIDASLQKLK
jgi:tetratricopeptide (TPR) repeat protein